MPPELLAESAPDFLGFVYPSQSLSQTSARPTITPIQLSSILLKSNPLKGPHILVGCT
jgi:hypothetical protein